MRSRTFPSQLILALIVISGLLFGPLMLSAQQLEKRESKSAGWVAQNGAVLNRLYTVFFADRQHGWAAGSNGLLLITADGGATWKKVIVGQRDVIRDLFFIDSERGFLAGEFSIFNRRAEDISSDRAFLSVSSDAGRNWQNIELRNKDLDSSDQRQYNGNGLLRLIFADDRTGWAIGEAGLVLASRDGGKTWLRQRSPVSKLLYDICAIDDQQAWIVGGGGAILRTVDGGKNWNEQASGITQTLNSVHFVDNKYGWAVGLDGTILATTNGGNRWQQQTSGVGEDLHSVFFTSKTEGWAAGDRGTLIHTTNGGQSWEMVSLRTRSHLTRLFFVAPDCGWVVGSNGAIFKYQSPSSGL